MKNNIRKIISKIVVVLSFIFLLGCASTYSPYLPYKNKFYEIKSTEYVRYYNDCSNKVVAYRDYLVKKGIKADVVAVKIVYYNDILHKKETVLHALVKYQNPETKQWHYADPTLNFPNGILAKDSGIKELWTFSEKELMINR